MCVDESYGETLAVHPAGQRRKYLGETRREKGSVCARWPISVEIPCWELVSRRKCDQERVLKVVCKCDGETEECELRAERNVSDVVPTVSMGRVRSAGGKDIVALFEGLTRRNL